MNILIISRSVWSTQNSFGNTFSNIFGDLPDAHIYNICCQGGQVNNDVTVKCFQLTDKTVAQSILKRNHPVGKVVSSQNASADESPDFSGRTMRMVKAKRGTLALLARDMIWKAGRWKKSGELKKFILEANPDVLYIPIYNSWYMCDIHQFVVELTGKAAVAHITDDDYGYPSTFSPLKLFYHAVLRKKMRSLISHCSYIEVFSQNMKEEYEKIFHKKCYLIGKCVNLDAIKAPDAAAACPKHYNFVYTGNIGNGRWKVLCSIGRALDAIGKDYDAKLTIYSGTRITSKIEKELQSINSVRFMGSISSADVIRVQKEADFLVHVEGFAKKDIREVRMSFSTKIIDYLCTGKPLLAVGPEEVNSMRLLIDNKLAIAATGEGQISEEINKIFSGQIDYVGLQRSVYQYLITYRNKETIQNDIMDRMRALLSESKGCKE